MTMCMYDNKSSQVENVLYVLLLIYFPSFNKLTERYFEKSPWPDAEYVAGLVDGGMF